MTGLDKQKRLMWGKALFFGDRTTYYQLPLYFLCKVIDLDDENLLLEVRGAEVRKKCSEVIRIGRKVVAFKSFYNVFQGALNGIETSLNKLQTYDSFVAINNSSNPATENIILAQIPNSPTECDWGRWEVDPVTRIGVSKHNNAKLLQLSNNEYVPQTHAFVSTEKEWELLKKQYDDVVFAQKNLVKFLEASVQTYEQFARSQEVIKLSREENVTNNDEEIYETLVKYPQLSLRQIGEQIGFKSSESIFVYYEKLKATLPLEKVQLILRPGDTIGSKSKGKGNTLLKSRTKKYDELSKKYQKEIAEKNIICDRLQQENTDMVSRIKLIMQKYEEAGIAKGQGRSDVRNLLNDLWDCFAKNE